MTNSKIQLTVEDIITRIKAEAREMKENDESVLGTPKTASLLGSTGAPERSRV
jgi:hypothetical protein